MDINKTIENVRGKVRIRFMTMNDVNGVASVHKLTFIRQHHSKEWITCNMKAYPLVQYFVAADETNDIVGFVNWSQKSGFRQDVVLELAQIAVHPSYQGCGIGTLLITKSLPHVQAALARRGARVKHVLVTTRSDNNAQRLYRKVLGAEVEATLSDLYSADEVIMVARDIVLADSSDQQG